MCNCKVKNINDTDLVIGDYIETTHKGARYFLVVKDVLTEKKAKQMNKTMDFPYNLVGIRIGSIITNCENCEGDFISTHDSWWSLKDCQPIKNLLDTPSKEDK